MRDERENCSFGKSFGVHSLDSVLLKREVPGPSDVVCSEVANDRVTTQQLARGDQTEHDGSSSLIPCGTSMRSQWIMQCPHTYRRHLTTHWHHDGCRPTWASAREQGDRHTL